MGEADSEILLSWSNFLGWELFLLAFISVVVIGLIIYKAALFWPLLIISCIVGTGPRIKGYFFLDEILTIAVLSGAVIRLAVVRHNPQSGSVRDRLHRYVFGLWVGYMIAESILGIVANEDLRIVRWVIFYLTLAVLFLLTNKQYREFSFPPIRQVIWIVLITTSAVYVAYLVQGAYFDTLLGQHGRFLSQDSVWAGSAYATFPTLIAMPIAVFALLSAERKIRLLAWVTLGLMVATAFYFDSRVSWLVVLSFLAVALPTLKLHQILMFPVLFVLGFILITGDPTSNLGGFFANLYEASQAIWSPGKSDVNRQLQLHAAFMRTFDNVKTFFIGDGMYSHRFTVIPYISHLYDLYLPEQDFIIRGSRRDELGMTIFRTTGFTALLVDTGVIGMVLFCANYVLAARSLWRSSSRHRLILLFTLGMSFLWLFVNNITDIILLYLLFLPHGLLHELRLKIQMK